MDLEAQRPEVVAHFLRGLGRGSLRVLQLVVQAQRMPLVLAQLVEGQDLDTIDDVLPTRDNLADLAYVLRIVGQARNEDETNPDARRATARSNAITELDRGCQGASRRLLVGRLVAALDVQEPPDRVIPPFVVRKIRR